MEEAGGDCVRRHPPHAGQMGMKQVFDLRRTRNLVKHKSGGPEKVGRFQLVARSGNQTFSGFCPGTEYTTVDDTVG